MHRDIMNRCAPVRKTGCQQGRLSMSNTTFAVRQPLPVGRTPTHCRHERRHIRRPAGGTAGTSEKGPCWGSTRPGQEKHSSNREHGRAGIRRHHHPHARRSD